MKQWETQVLRPAELHKINKHSAVEYGPQGTRGRFLPAVVSSQGRVSPDFLRLMWLLSHQQVQEFLRPRGPNWDPNQHQDWIKAVRGRFFQRIKGRICASLAVACALRLVPRQPHPAQALFPSLPLDLSDIPPPLLFPSQPSPPPSP